MVALPNFPHFSHLYPESKRSLLVNLSRAEVILASAMFAAGEVDRDDDMEDPLLDDDEGVLTGRMSNPTSSKGSILQDVELHAEQVTFDSTVPRNKRKGYSLSASSLCPLSEDELDEDDVERLNLLLGPS